MVLTKGNMALRHFELIYSSTPPPFSNFMVPPLAYIAYIGLTLTAPFFVSGDYIK